MITICLNSHALHTAMSDVLGSFSRPWSEPKNSIYGDDMETERAERMGKG